MEFTSICEVCGSTNLREVLDLGIHPLCDDLIPEGSTAVSPKYPIIILLCQTCKTAHQKFQVPKIELFPKTYHYRSRFTEDVLGGMRKLVSDVDKFLNSGVKNRIVLDIGSNDGSLLKMFRHLGAITIGVEPTDAAKECDKESHFTFQEYLSLDLAQRIKDRFGFPDVITFTNVFAHIENLPLVIESLKHLIGPNTLLVIENHYLGSILEKNQFDTFYHEHPRTYSASSFEFIAKSLDAIINRINFTERYGGNIQVFISKNEPKIKLNHLNKIIQKERQFEESFKIMKESIEIWKKHTKILIQELNHKFGAIPAKAFPGRAAILIQLLGLDKDQIIAVYEKPGSQKIGNYVPGTRILIKSDLELTTLANELPIINFAWHISDEIAQYLSDLNYEGEIINIINQELFK
jgi:hypothetical protein